MPGEQDAIKELERQVGTKKDEQFSVPSVAIEEKEEILSKKASDERYILNEDGVVLRSHLESRVRRLVENLLYTGGEHPALRSRPFIIAAFNSAKLWRNMAQYALGKDEDVGAYINDLVTDGEADVFLAPGDFTVDTTIAPAADEDLHLAGCKEWTVLKPGSSISAGGSLIKLHSSATGDYLFRNFTLDDNGTRLYGAAMGAYLNPCSSERWENVAIRISEGTDTPYSSGFYRCANLDGCTVTPYGTYLEVYECFRMCSFLSNCSANYNISSTAGVNISGFYACYSLTACKVNFLDDTLSLCIGFGSCQQLSSCHFYGATDGSSETRAYNGCHGLAACYAEDSPGYGFHTCDHLSACRAAENASGNFKACDYVTVCESGGSDGDGFYDCEHVVANRSYNNAGYGFNACKQCQQNYASGNTTGQYNASYADQSTNACANTAAGGYNR